MSRIVPVSGMRAKLVGGYQNHKSAHTDFALRDQRGRKVGTLAISGEATFEALPEEGVFGGWYQLPAGHLFYGSINATRDGNCYGPGGKRVWFTSAAERDEYLKGAVETSRKNFTKKFPQ
jgi:hypothetical protein